MTFLKKGEVNLKNLAQYYHMRGDLVALEDLRQYSLVVKDEDGLRYIKTDDDIGIMETYFVYQAFPTGSSDLIVEEGSYVRAAKVNLMFGLI